MLCSGVASTAQVRDTKRIMMERMMKGFRAEY